MAHADESDGLPADTQVGRTALGVAELREATDFYRSVVGLEVLERDRSSATLGVDGTELLVVAEEPDAGSRPETAAGLFHNAFRVPTRAALGDALGRIRERWQLDGASNHLVSEALYLTDPDGNGVEIYRDFPRADWPTDADGTVRMATEPLDLDALDAAATGDDRAPTGTDVGHVHLEVTSPDAFRAVYVDVLGFDVQETAPGALFVSAGGYHHHVGANRWNQRRTAAQGRGLSWFEVVVPGTDALDVVQDRVAASGVDFHALDRGIAITEPDGIEVRLRPEL